MVWGGSDLDLDLDLVLLVGLELLRTRLETRMLHQHNRDMRGYGDACCVCGGEGGVFGSEEGVERFDC